jgi:hypothetical protein
MTDSVYQQSEDGIEIVSQFLLRKLMPESANRTYLRT